MGVKRLLAANPALKLKPVVLLYFGGNKDVIQSLESNNTGLYRRIESLEKQAPQDANMSFVGLGNAGRLRIPGQELLTRTTVDL